MGRIPRSFLLYDGCYAHVISRSIAKQRIFEKDHDFRIFEKLLKQAKVEFDFKIFHYCLMHTHFHLIVRMESVESFSNAMKQVKWEYTQEYNRSRSRRGSIWQNRFKSLLIENEAYLYACGLYVEKNPVTAGLVKAAVDWEFSSTRHSLRNNENPLITNYAFPDVPKDLTMDDGADFERGSVVGSGWFKYKLKNGI